MPQDESAPKHQRPKKIRAPKPQDEPKQVAKGTEYFTAPKRFLDMHMVGPLDEQLTIGVMDDPGEGGANHVYQIVGPNGVWFTEIRFQNGPVKEAGVNGISNEALLAIVYDRLHAFQAGPYACDENAAALRAVDRALGCLKQRTHKRLARGVEGTNKP